MLYVMIYFLREVLRNWESIMVLLQELTDAYPNIPSKHFKVCLIKLTIEHRGNLFFDFGFLEMWVSVGLDVD